MHAFPIRDLPLGAGAAPAEGDLGEVVAFPRDGSADRRRVVVRLLGDDTIEVGRAGERGDALRLARDVIARIEAATARAEWPEIADRLLRPDAIVSIDVERAR